MKMHRSILVALALAAFVLGFQSLRAQNPAPASQNPAEFVPDGAVKGSALTGWKAVGDADWKVQNGEIIGTPRAGGAGGWLVMEKGFEDVQLFTNYRCTGSCKSGILLRAAKQADGGMKGMFVSLTDGEYGSYHLTVDAAGKETARERITAAPRAGGAGGAGGGGAAATAGRAAGGGGAAPAGGRAAGAPAAAPAAGERGGAAAPAAPAANAQAPAAAAPARGGGGGGGGGGRGAAPSLKAGEWNPLNITLSQTNLRVVGISGTVGTMPPEAMNGYGPIALYAGGTGEVRFKDFAWMDLNAINEPKAVVSSRFTAQEISGFYYGWSTAGGDFNKDGNIDIAYGPFYFLGPDFTKRHIFRAGRMYNPSTEYSPDMVNLAGDFTGDGWADIMSSEMQGGRPMDLYVNPRGENRRWDKFRVLPTVSTEVVVKGDIDKDGKPEFLFAGGGVYNWAKPDPANPTAAWKSNPISVPAAQGGPTTMPHGIGLGDVNGDSRNDVVLPNGWLEQPPAGMSAGPWTYHKYDFGDNVTFGNGGGEIGVYDINGDGLTDVVMGQAHNWGIYWYEHKKGPAGEITWVQHPITVNFSTQNAGNLVLAESHASRIVDMNGDRIPDFVTGKRYWSHLENYNGPDPYGPAVVVIYRTVRDKAAPGGARFVPEVVHNRSGVGSSFEVMDINKDGVPDISTAGAYGAFVFLSKPGAGRAAAPAAAPKK
jgi:hypothetical protein